MSRSEPADELMICSLDSTAVEIEVLTISQNWHKGPHRTKANKNFGYRTPAKERKSKDKEADTVDEQNEVDFVAIQQ